MGAISGKKGRVMIGTNVFVANIKSWTWAGQTAVVIEKSALEDNYVQKEIGINNSGSVEIVGNYDPGDSTGQEVLASNFSNRTKMTTLKFAIDTFGTSYYVPDLTNDSSACAIVSKCNNIGFDENGMASVAFTIDLGGKWTRV